MKTKGDTIHIPFRGNTRKEISSARKWAKEEYPNQRYKYIKPKWMKFKNPDWGYWSYPEMQVTITQTQDED